MCRIMIINDTKRRTCFPIPNTIDLHLNLLVFFKKRRLKLTLNNCKNQQPLNEVQIDEAITMLLQYHYTWN